MIMYSLIITKDSLLKLFDNLLTIMERPPIYDLLLIRKINFYLKKLFIFSFLLLRSAELYVNVVLC